MSNLSIPPQRAYFRTFKQKPTVSIIINNYNYGRFLKAAIDSVLFQRYTSLSAADIELIVVDDGSSDQSCEIIKSYGSLILPIFKQNGGQDSAFNAGFQQSRGEIVCFLDADDRFTPNKIETVVKCFQQNPRIGWCFHEMLLEDARTSATICTTKAFPGPAQNLSQYCDFRKQLRLGSLSFYPVATSGLCFRRSVLQQILPMPETFIKTSADRYVRLAALGLSPGYFIAQALTVQGIHGNNLSTMRRDRPSIPERQIIIAYLLRTQFPELRRYANRLFSRGLAAYRSIKSSTVAANYQPFIRRYWQQCSLIEKLTITLLQFYHLRPWRQPITHKTADFYNFSAKRHSTLQSTEREPEKAPTAR